MRAWLSWPMVLAYLLSAALILIMLLESERPAVGSPPGWVDSVGAGFPEPAGTRFPRRAW